MYKKRDARAKLLFCQSKPLAFLTFCTLQTIQIGQVPAKIFNFASRDFHRFEENIEFEGISASG